MRQILLMMVLVALVGCGKKEPAQPSASKPEPTKDKTTAEDKLWEFETGDAVYSSPAIGSDGTVYVGSYDKKLYAINGKTGASFGNLKQEGSSCSPPPPSALMAPFTSGHMTKSSMLFGRTPKAPQKVLGRCLDIMPNTLDV